MTTETGRGVATGFGPGVPEIGLGVGNGVTPGCGNVMTVSVGVLPIGRTGWIGEGVPLIGAGVPLIGAGVPLTGEGVPSGFTVGVAKGERVPNSSGRAG